MVRTSAQQQTSVNIERSIETSNMMVFSCLATAIVLTRAKPFVLSEANAIAAAVVARDLTFPE